MRADGPPADREPPAGGQSRSRLSTAFATPESKRRYNREIFTTIAPSYDTITVLLSYGQDRRWKDRLAELASVQAGEVAVDLACGTGDLGFRLADRGARVVGVDLTPRMLACASERDTLGAMRLVAGDMMALPIRTGNADLVTAGYGLRNVPVLETSLAEILRVLRPGGRFLSLDFNRPETPWLRRAYLAYLWGVGSALGWWLHRDPDTYRYISASLSRYPGAEGVAAAMQAAGFTGVTWQPLLGGLMATHQGRKPPD